MTSITIEKAVPEDLQQIFTIQKLAYQDEAKIYDNFKIPPLLETLKELKNRFHDSTILKATKEGRIIGSVRVQCNCAVCHISRLMVHPEFQNRGIATQLLLRVEDLFPSSRRFELFTGEKSLKNIRLYEKLGYQIYAKDQPPGNVMLVYMAKNR